MGTGATYNAANQHAIPLAYCGKTGEKECAENIMGVTYEPKGGSRRSWFK